MSTTPQSTAIAKAESLLPAKPLDRIEDLNQAYDSLKGRAIILSPVARIDHLMPMHQVSLRAVKIDPTIGAGGGGPECYKGGFCKEGEVALGKNALTKILSAAGANVVSRERNDDRSNPNYCEITVVVAHQDFDGVWRQYIGTKELDLRDGSVDAKTMKPLQLNGARQHIQSLCETKAIERAIRGIFSIRQTYKAADLERMPVVIPKLVPMLDPNDPETKTALIRHALSGEQRLYGGPAQGEEVRNMRDVTPPRPAALPIGATVASDTPDELPAPGPGPDDREEEPARDDFETLSFEKPAPVLCGCPCGCQRDLPPEAVKITVESMGAPRCRECYPGRGFNISKHAELRGPLGLPKQPSLTADDVKGALERAAKGK